mgnify:CR=1 FL=1
MTIKRLRKLLVTLSQRLKGDFREEDVNRDDAGKFSTGGGGGSSEKPSGAKPGGQFGKLSGSVEKAHASAERAITNLFGLSRKDRAAQVVPVLKSQLKTLRNAIAEEATELLPKVVDRLEERTGLPEEAFAPLKGGVASFARSATEDTAHAFQEIAAGLQGKDVAAWELDDAREKLHAAYDLAIDGHSLIDSFE